MLKNFTSEASAAIILSAISISCGPGAPKDKLSTVDLKLNDKSFELVSVDHPWSKTPPLKYDLPEAEEKLFEQVRDISLVALDLTGDIVQHHNVTGYFVEPEKLVEVLAAGQIASQAIYDYLRNERFSKVVLSEPQMVYGCGTVSEPEDPLKLWIREINEEAIWTLFQLEDIAEAIKKEDGEAAIKEGEFLVDRYKSFQSTVEYLRTL